MKITKKQVKKICEKLKVDFISFEFLGRGNHNVNYLIEAKQDRFVLRIEDNFYFDNLKREFNFLRKTEGRFGPKVFLFDDSKKIIDKIYLVEEFVEGSNPEKCDVKLIKRMAKWYKQLHKDKKKARYNLLSAFKKITLEEYQKFKHDVDIDLLHKLDLVYEETVCVIENNSSLFREREILVLKHGDPSRMNILIDKNENLRLIDWEFVKYGLREFELAFFIWSYNLKGKRRKLFLDSYGYPNSKKYKKRLDLIYLVHVLSMISWKIHRLDLVYKGKMNKGLYCSTKEEIYHEIKKDLVKARSVLRRLK